jgi:hypothetical protein
MPACPNALARGHITIENKHQHMKTTFISILLLTLWLTGCQVVGSIFGAGVYTGVFIVVLIIGLIVIVATRISKKDK